MSDFVFDHLEHVLCILILVSRIGDIGTTYLITPTLALEANPIMRRLGWRFALLSLAVCFVPYYSVYAGVMILVPFLLVSAGNAGRIWVARTIGEDETKAFMLRVAAASKLRYALSGVVASAAFLVLLGGVVVVLCPDSDDLAHWVGLGIIAYGLVVGIYGSLYSVRLFKQAEGAPAVRAAT